MIIYYFGRYYYLKPCCVNSRSYGILNLKELQNYIKRFPYCKCNQNNKLVRVNSYGELKSIKIIDVLQLQPLMDKLKKGL
jgi:hypothetical protein